MSTSILAVKTNEQIVVVARQTWVREQISDDDGNLLAVAYRFDGRPRWEKFLLAVRVLLSLVF